MQCDSFQAVGMQFPSIPVESLNHLLEDIKQDFEEWIKRDTPVDNTGRPFAWNGFSGSVQNFFKSNNINPYDKYNARYSSGRHTVGLSYVWSATTLREMAGSLHSLVLGHLHSVFFLFWCLDVCLGNPSVLSRK